MLPFGADWHNASSPVFVLQTSSLCIPFLFYLRSKQNYTKDELSATTHMDKCCWQGLDALSCPVDNGIFRSQCRKWETSKGTRVGSLFLFSYRLLKIPPTRYQTHRSAFLTWAKCISTMETFWIPRCVSLLSVPVPCCPFFSWIYSKTYCSSLELWLFWSGAVLMMCYLHLTSLSCLGSSCKQTLQGTPLPPIYWFPSSLLPSFLPSFLSSFPSDGGGLSGEWVASTMRQGMILTWSPKELPDQDTYTS